MNQMVKMFGQHFASQHLPVDIFCIMPGGVSTDLNHHLQSPFVRPVEEGAAAVVKIATDGRHHQGKVVSDYGFGKMVKRVVFSHQRHH